MLKGNQFEVLGAIRMLLKLTNLYNKNNIYLGSIPIPDFPIFVLISIPSFYFAMLLIWRCIDVEFDIELMSISFSDFFGFSQMTVVYISLAVKKYMIITTVDHLQELVQESKDILLNFLK